MTLRYRKAFLVCDLCDVDDDNDGKGWPRKIEQLPEGWASRTYAGFEKHFCSTCTPRMDDHLVALDAHCAAYEKMYGEVYAHVHAAEWALEDARQAAERAVEAWQQENPEPQLEAKASKEGKNAV